MITSKNQQTEQRLIRRKEVQTKTGLGASSIYAMMKNGEFQCLHYLNAVSLGLNQRLTSGLPIVLHSIKLPMQ
jgi:hypothetical protein